MRCEMGVVWRSEVGFEGVVVLEGKRIDKMEGIGVNVMGRIDVMIVLR
jgi:hypothetical protein